MEVIDIEWLLLPLGLLIGAGASYFATASYFNKGLDQKSQTLQREEKRLKEDNEQRIKDAEKAAQNRKRELLLQAKEEVHQAKMALESDAKEKQQELFQERKRIEKKESKLERKINDVDERESLAEAKAEALVLREADIERAEAHKKAELERISGLTISEAQEQVMDTARQEFSHDIAKMLRQMEDEAKETADLKAKEIIVTSIQRYASDYVSDATVTVVSLPNEEMKGRIIGREGRNIRAIERLTGVDLIIDDTPEAVILSCFDPIRREIARIAIEKLVFDGRIHPARIEEMVHKAKKEVEQSMREAGEEAVYESGVVGLHPEIIKLLGRMKYRTSYGQNVLKHSLEVCALAGAMAAELDLDVAMAKRAGLLHDLGKAVDFEMEGSHVTIGSELARKYREHDIVINGIESHHGDVEFKYMISFLVAAADAISAARPGARRENVETYIKRIEQLEAIAKRFDGVEECYAVQAGREIRVMVKPDLVKDEDMIIKAREMSKQIEDELSYPGQIKIHMIRESRITEYAK